MSRAFTLIELLGALAILGLAASTAGLALPTLRPAPESVVLRSLAEARSAAVRSGEPVIWRQDSVAVRFLPDGSSSGGRIAVDSVALLVDPLTGAARGAR